MAVALSGGVDSAVAAWLCIKAGCRVIGVTLALGADEWAGCAGISDGRSTLQAERVADRLRIPHVVFDAREQFRSRVLATFLSGMVAGATPNPCVVCNELRFSLLIDKLPDLGAHFLATGHYARVALDDRSRWGLRRGADRAKDQSYMLYRLSAAHLGRTLFPLGGLTKAEVRSLASSAGLPVAERCDSMDLCWLGGKALSAFLDCRLPSEGRRPGPIVDGDGRVLGSHRGLAYYTIGQRRGLGLALGEPLYVVEKDVAANALRLGRRNDLLARAVKVTDVHWIAGEPPGPVFRAEVQVRYRALPVAALLETLADGLLVVFDQPQVAATPGQALVLYRGEACLGGGTIAAVERLP